MPVPQDFWGTTAQVIPALLLTYVVERQYTEPSDSAPRWVATLFVVPTVSFTLLGEFLALRGLLGDGGAWSARAVVISIGLMCTLIVGSFLIDYATRNLPDEAAVNRHVFLTAFFGCLGLPIALAGTLLPLAASVWVAVSI